MSPTILLREFLNNLDAEDFLVGEQYAEILGLIWLGIWHTRRFS
jgi:hypothetical protein